MTGDRLPRKLGLLHAVAGHDWRGRERQALALAAGLAAKGHRVTLAAAPGSPASAAAARAGLDVPPFPGWTLRRAAALRRLLEGGAWDIVHLHDPAALAALVWAGLWRPRVACVLTVRGDMTYGGRALPRGAPVKRVDLFFAASEWVWSALVRAGIAEDRIAVAHPGIDLERFKPLAAEAAHRRDQARRPLGLAPEDFVVGSVLHLAEGAGVGVLMEAGRRIRSGLTPPGEPRLRILVVGGGPHRARLEAEAARLGMAGATVFAGPSEDVPGMMAAMDLYAHPAVSGDGFPTALREAMAMSLPAVATDLTGIREIIDNGKHGLIVPCGDPENLALNIMRMRRDPDFARQLGKAGSLKVQRYGLRAAVDRAEELYFRLVR